ncbi:MAG TPA: CsgG/HfaB family protein [bacterium]|nr:CsgG/HfaB family protein [bacterium]
MKKFMHVFIFCFLFITNLYSQTTIAVLQLLPKNVSKGDASALTDRLAIEMVRTGNFTVIERERLDAILDEQGFQLSGCTSNECAVEIGRMANVEQVVAGSVSKVGSVYSIAARIVGVESGEILHIATFDYEGKIGQLLKTGMGVIAKELAGIDNEEQIDSQEQLVEVEPSSQVPQEKVYTPEYSPPQRETRSTSNQSGRSKIAAQSPSNKMGIIGGGISSGLIGEDVPDDFTTRPMGISAGIMFKYSVLKDIALRIEWLYTQKGYAFPTSFEYIEQRNLLDYMEFPFLLQLDLRDRSNSYFYINIGASLGFNQAAQIQVYNTNENEEMRKDDLQGVREQESVLLFGGGFILGDLLFSEFRVNMGMTSIIDSDFGDPDIRNFGMTVIFGLQFSVGS